MSSSLHWRPTNHDGQRFGDALKFILRERFGGGIIGDWTEVGNESLDFLEGVLATTRAFGSGRSAPLLKNLRTTHGTIEIREVF